MKKLLGNQSGVALIMVMTSLIILMALWGEFTFESKLSRIKTTNMLDKSQARLVAESGVELAMARLKLYKEAFNTWSKNEAARSSVSIQLLNQLWEIPFIYPIPVVPDAGAQVKAAITEFQKESILEGELKVSIQNISNKLNLNMMRVSMLAKAAAGAQGGLQANAQGGGNAGVDGGIDGGDQGGGGGGGGEEEDPAFSMEQQLLKHLVIRLREKGEEDEAFRDRFGSVDPRQLVANLKFYISDKNPRRQNLTQVDMLMDNSEQLFVDAKITPKYGPLSSFSELHLIPGWDDAIVDLIKGEFDVFPLVMIDLNRITASMLRLLIPSINPDEIKEFFRFKDDPNNPRFFNTIEDFKAYIVNRANIISAQAFDELFTKYQAQGIQFGSAPTLFRIVSEGSSSNSSTTLTATVVMPVQPQLQPQAGAQGGAQQGQQGGTPRGQQGGSSGGDEDGAQGGGQGNGNQNGGAGGAGEQPTQLLEPRIIEILVN